MNDLLLWRLLGGALDATSPEALATLLEQLAALPLKHRFPFLARLDAALRHPDARVRAGAVRAMRGADGLPALNAIVAALDDLETSVPAAAALAMSESASGAAGRWLHLLFHPRAVVRRAALALDEAIPDALELHLLADPETVELVRPRVEAMAAPRAPAPPLHALFAVLALSQRGAMQAPLARALFGHVTWNTTVRMLSGSRERARADVEALAGAAATERGPTREIASRVDALDELLELFWVDDDDADARAVTAFFRSLALGVRTSHSELLERVVAAIVATAVRTGSWPAPAARALVLMRPVLLAWSWVPIAARRASLTALRDPEHAPPRLEDSTLKRLVLESELARREDGTLDLGAVAALLRLAQHTPIRLLRSWLGTERILDAFVRDVEGSLPLLLLEDGSRRGHADLMHRIARRDPVLRGRVLGLLALEAPLDRLGFLESLEGELAAIVLAELASRTVPAKRAARLGEVLGKLCAHDYPTTFLSRWLVDDAAVDGSIGRAALAVVATELEAERFVDVARELPSDRLVRLCRTASASVSFPYGKEVALARALLAHEDPAIRAWAEERVPPIEAEPRPRAPRPAGVRDLPERDATRIASCPEADLPRALSACLAEPMKGVTAALAKRPDPSRPSIPASVALLGAGDPLDQVDAELVRFAVRDVAWLPTLDAETARTWNGLETIGPAGHAWLHRWERHAFAFAAGLDAGGATLASTLDSGRTLRFVELRASIWDAAATLLGMWRWRDRDRFARECTDALADLLVDSLAGDHGEAAARMLSTMRASGLVAGLVESRRAKVVAALPDLCASVREILSGWVRSEGLAAPVAKRPSIPADAAVLARIKTTHDLDELVRACKEGAPALVQEAALRLVELGGDGVGRLVRLLDEPLAVPTLSAIAESVALWPEGPWLEDLAERARDAIRAPEVRFRMAVGLFERGAVDMLPIALEAASVASERPWFRPEDWERLRRLGAGETLLALALARSPEPHAYRHAVDHLLGLLEVGDEIHGAVRGFLECGTGRMNELRVRAARWLAERSDSSGWPIVLARAADEKSEALVTARFATPALVVESVRALIAGGPRLGAELTALELLEVEGVDPIARAEALEVVVLDACSETARARATSRLGASRHRPRKVREVAEAFAWGVLRGRELTGRLFTVKMLRGRGLGHTRLDTSVLHVSALPILRREQHGRETVEGLVLHEIGHHVFHRGVEQQAVWTEAHEEGVHGLLNLVADEHLERNLRAMDQGFGDRLKRLASYAFMRSAREIDAGELLGALGGWAFDVLSATRLGVARRKTAVMVTSGEVLSVIERAGMPFGRFVRALRMGLGNRQGDPDVDRGLELFRGGFRHSSMPDLLRITRGLRTIFGWQTRLVETFGGHESLGSDGGEMAAHGEEIADEEIDAEIDRILDPRQRPRGKDGEARGRRWIFVGTDETFAPITNIQKLPYDPVEHAKYAALVARSARRMRRFFERLGLAMRAERMRVAGRRFDPTRARALVTRGDPRILISRRIEVHTDLFLGMVIDCSGSMASGDHMEQAKRFGALLAEAARELPGIDVRVFGFTDKTIWDCGDAERCSVHALRANGGNNDAAALWHVAQVARASGRKARLVVMISDGLPTECTVAALKAVVGRLARMRIACAQVAVQRLEEICFPHHVVLEEADADAAVRRFGSIVARLVQRTMSAG